MASNPGFQFEPWFTRQQAKTLREAQADLFLVPNVHTLRIDDNGNTFAARGSGLNVTTAVNNVGIGSLALPAITSGTNNVALGRATLFLHTTGNNNTAIGHAALLRSVSCSACIGIGNTAGGTAVDGSAGTFPLTNDLEMILIGTQTGKASTAQRTGGIAIGNTVAVPVKDNVGVIGGPSFTDLMTPGRFYQSWRRSTETSATGVTLTAAQMLSGWIVRSGTGGDVTDTTPTAALLVSGGPGVGAPANTTRLMAYYNSDAADTITIGAGSGVTLSGTMTVPPNSFGWFLIEYTNTSSGSEAVVIYRVGDSTQLNDADLTALAGLSTTGMVARTGSATYATRTLTAPAAGITVSNGDGVSGNPTLALANDLSALEGLASTGIAVRSTTDTWVQRSVAGTANEIVVANGDGVSANPTISISTATILTGKTITGGAFSGGTWDNGAIGGTTPAAGTFTIANSSLAFQLNGGNALVLSGGNHWLRGVDGSNAFRAGATSSGAWLTISAGSTTKAQINMPASSPKTTPVTGDFWFESTSSALRFRDAGGTTRTITWV